MCRGANLGVCCELGCDEKIQCQDTGGYCPAHDPYDWEATTPNHVVDDPEKRRLYDLDRVTRGIKSAEASIQAAELNLAKLRDRQRDLSAPAVPGSPA